MDLYRGADKSLARPGRKQTRKHVRNARDFNNIGTRAFIKFFFVFLGGLRLACWPTVPKFAGSNPAEAVGFLGRKNPQHTFLRRGSKALGPMS